MDTWIWLPLSHEGPFPAVLRRTPYQDGVLSWASTHAISYRDHGYAVVMQLVRGVGESEGSWRAESRPEFADGYDTVEWIAAQNWCDGAVGMFGGSYSGKAQLWAAAAAPPHLKCIMPAVPSIHPFLHGPRFGGAFERVHALGWAQNLQVADWSQIIPGYKGAASMFANPESWKRLLSRPAIDAADGILTDERHRYYINAIRSCVLDADSLSRTLTIADYRNIAVPALLITGVFDATMGTQYLWRQLEEHGRTDVERFLLIGPWDHAQASSLGAAGFGPWRFEEALELNLQTLRLAFLDRHLRGAGSEPTPARVTGYVLRANRWISTYAYPHPKAEYLSLFLRGEAPANLRGNGRLSWESPTTPEPSDSFQSDPTLPFVPVGATLDPDLVLDLRETERQEDVLVYSTTALEEDLILFGEFQVELHLAVDAPDCDITCWLAEAPPSGHTTMLSHGLLRLRYREGWDREVLLTPNEPVTVKIPMYHLAHAIPAGSKLRLLIGSGEFPTVDPNPNTGEPIATAVKTRIAKITVFHDLDRPSFLNLPVLPNDALEGVSLSFTARTII